MTGNRIKRLIVIMLIGLFVCGVFVSAEEAKPIAVKERVSGRQGQKLVPGFIFNLDNILFDIDSYQGGFGLKLKNLIVTNWFTTDLRALFAFNYESEDQYAFSVGTTLEFPVFAMDEHVNPYLGLLVDVDVNYLNEIVGSNWTKTTTLPINIGAVAGIEVFLLDYLSFFAEYNLVASIYNTYVSTNTATEPAATTDYRFFTELGNAGTIGMVIYFGPAARVDGKR